MKNDKRSKIYILDTSAIFSGKFLNLVDVELVTTSGVSKEISPGGRDFRNFQFLLEKGLKIRDPLDIFLQKVDDISKQTGDFNRISTTDKEIIALAIELKKEQEDVVIISDDYSIQNVAGFLKIKYESISQRGIKKTFKWTCQCSGCGKKFKEHIKICPICGDSTKNVVSKRKNI